jgi:hypothetical protein
MPMIDYDPKDADFVSGDEFVALARAVLESRNTGNFSNDWIEIRTNYNGLDLQVTRQKQFIPPDEPNHRKSHLCVSNPTTMVKNGEVIRHHGEHCYLTQHMRDLIANA